jgi:hypothetical protein
MQPHSFPDGTLLPESTVSEVLRNPTAARPERQAFLSREIPERAKKPQSRSHTYSSSVSRSFGAGPFIQPHSFPDGTLLPGFLFTGDISI